MQHPQLSMATILPRFESLIHEPWKWTNKPFAKEKWNLMHFNDKEALIIALKKEVVEKAV